MIRLHVNVDHVATVRKARGTRYPDPLEAAFLCERAGAHGITVHLREDRRHIEDDDVIRLRNSIHSVLNLEMAPTDEMTAVAASVKPDLVTLVPERREERTTEGGLDLVAHERTVARVIEALVARGVPVSLFIDPDSAQVDKAKSLGARTVEFHTGDYAHAQGANIGPELERLHTAARFAAELGLEVAAGHGLTRTNVGPLVRAVPQIQELNIGHAIVSDAIMVGMDAAVRAFLREIA